MDASKYFNSTQKDMSMEDVKKGILDFISKDPEGEFRLMVGTDSQLIGQCTCFATGIVIHKRNSGAWCCVKKVIEPRRVKSLSEKIHMETATTYEIICTLSDLVSTEIAEMLLPFKEANVRIEAHIDVGTKGATRVLIREMVGYFEGIGIEAKIKPNSFVASSYANKYSKRVG